MFEIVQRIIEIREDDYKQNEVYRPWPVETGAETTEKVDAPPAQGHPGKRVVSLPSQTRPQ
jgi:hypothetical protein